MTSPQRPRAAATPTASPEGEIARWTSHLDSDGTLLKAADALPAAREEVRVTEAMVESAEHAYANGGVTKSDRMRAALEAALRQAPAAPSQEAVLRVARLILSVSSISYDEANNERREMARAAAEKVIAVLASPQGQESGVTKP